MSKSERSTLAEVRQPQELQPLRFRDCEDGGLEQLTSPEEAAAAVKRMFGVADRDSLGTRLLGQTVGVITSTQRDAVRARDLNDAAQLLESIAPQDAVEGMLAVQMVGAHSAATRCLELAMLRDQTFAGRDLNLKHAARLLKCYSAQVEALGKYRNKAKQTLIVKHVHVNEGGQAIVGNVAQGEGVRNESGGTSPCTPPLRRGDQERFALQEHPGTRP